MVPNNKIDTQDIPDIRVVVKFKNNLLLRAMERAGIRTNKELERRSGVNHNVISSFICMRRPAKNKQEEWKEAAWAVASALHCDPEDIFSWFQQTSSLPKSTFTLGEVSSEVAKIAGDDDPEGGIKQLEVQNALQKAMSDLKPRLRQIIEMRFGMGEYDRTYTLREIGEVLGVTANCVRIYEAKALRILKHPNRADALQEYVSGNTGKPSAKLGQYLDESSKALQEHYWPKKAG